MSSSAPLVSIIIPCFNYGRYLGEAIESALAQTHQPVEVIVVDDGSTDNTQEVARRYPVSLLTQPNGGLAAAGNAGMRAAQGEFVMRLDADDMLAPTYVAETLAPMLADSNIAFVYTQVRYFGARTGSYKIEEFNPDTLAERNYVHGSALMRRAAFDAVGGYATGWRELRCEDWDLWLSFAEHGLVGRLVPKQLLHYRRHPGGSMVNFNLLSPAHLRREIRLAFRLKDRHPPLFSRAQLLRRLTRLPGRLRRQELSVRQALLLVGFCGVMLLRTDAA